MFLTKLIEDAPPYILSPRTDIIAERDGKRIVVQCKFYSKPVGNKAVQEAAAARLHERADKAIVVSNAAYTKAARQLAGTTGVILLHHDDLEVLVVLSLDYAFPRQAKSRAPRLLLPSRSIAASSCYHSLGFVGVYRLAKNSGGGRPYAGPLLIPLARGAVASRTDESAHGGLNMHSLLRIVCVAAAVVIACSHARAAEKTMPTDFVGDWCFQSQDAANTAYILPSWTEDGHCTDIN